MAFAEKAENQNLPPALVLVPSSSNNLTPLTPLEVHPEAQPKIKRKKEDPETLAWFEHKYSLVLRHYEKILAEGKRADAENFLRLMKWQINLRLLNVPPIARKFLVNHPNF